MYSNNLHLSKSLFFSVLVLVSVLTAGNLVVTGRRIASERHCSQSMVPTDAEQYSTLLEEGQTAQEQGDMPTAITKYRAAIDVYPKRPGEADQLLVDLYFHSHDYNHTIEIAEAAYNSHKGDDWIMAARIALSAIRNGNYTQANIWHKKYFEIHFAPDPDSAADTDIVVPNLTQSNATELAAGMLYEIGHFNLQQAGTVVDSKGIKQDLMDSMEAAKVAGTAVADSAQQVKAWSDLGDVLKKLGETKAALDAYVVARRKGDSNSDPRFLEGLDDDIRSLQYEL